MPFGKLTDKQRTLALVKFYIEEVHNRLHSPISVEEIELGCVDAAGDLGIDCIHRDDDTVLMIQSKYLSEGKTIDSRDIIHFQHVFERFYNKDFKPNQRLAEALAEIDLDRDSFVLKFITLGSISDQAALQTQAEVQFPVPDLADRVDFQYLDNSSLNQEHRDALSLNSGIPGDYELIASGHRGKRFPIIKLENAPYPSCVLVVDAPQLVNLYKQYKQALFTLNIRNYLGNTATNKLLIKTLRSESHHFYYFNNGISCLAEKLEPKEDRVVTKGLQIINGAQTIRSLAKVAANRSEQNGLKEALVLVRITQAATQYGAEGRFRNNRHYPK